MKITTRAVFQMTVNMGEYLPVSEESYEYAGPVAHAGGKDGPDTSGLEELQALSMQNSQLMNSLGMEELDWAKDQWGSQEELMNSILSTQQKLGGDVAGQADQWMQKYEKKFAPLEDQLVQDAQDYNTEWRREQEAGAAGADVATASAAARKNAQQRLEDFGIDPSDTRAAALDANVSQQEALGKVAAMNQAREDVRDTGYDLRGQAIDLGRNIQGDAQQAQRTGFDMTGAAGNQRNQTLAAGQQLRNQGILPYMAAGQGSVNAASNQAQAILGQQDSGGSALGTIGTVAGGVIGGIYGGPAGAAVGSQVGGAAGGALGGAATGGHVLEAVPTGVGSYDASQGYEDVGTQDGAISGPGGPKDDFIDAKLSDGEYVIPAEIVTRKGTEFFDKLIEQTKKNTPEAVNMGSGMLALPPGADDGSGALPQRNGPLPMPPQNAAIPVATGGYVTRRR